LAAYGALRLPAVDLEAYNVELKDDEGYVRDRANKGAFRRFIDEWRKRLWASSSMKAWTMPSSLIVRNAPDGVRELMLARWGMPGPPQFGGAPITNIRNTSSPHWRAWLNVGHRCVVPFNSFCEYADTKPRKTPTWFALEDDRPLAFFAGIWTSWHGRHESQSGGG
jgi:putative SOS response-associated peptidase YedK